MSDKLKTPKKLDEILLFYGVKLKLSGLINLDKPSGKTSHDMVAAVRRMLPRKTKVGHAGTLDPFATGVLIICLGQSTRLADYVADTHKQYMAEIAFAATSDTDDIDGQIAPTGSPAPPQSQLIEALKGFKGDIQQIPPAYCAVHVNGVRAYKLARTGQTVEISPRTVTIDNIELLDYTDGVARALIDCGKGTYIRSIARDLGQLLGCGAYCSSLRRTAIGKFRVESGVALEQLSADNIADHLKSPIEAVSHLQQVKISESELIDISYGKTIQPAAEQLSDEPIAAIAPDGQLAAICTTIDDESGQLLKPKVVFASPPQR